MDNKLTPLSSVFQFWEARRTTDHVGQVWSFDPDKGRWADVSKLWSGDDAMDDDDTAPSLVEASTAALRGADPPAWKEGSRSKTALEAIFLANPKLSTHPDDVDRAFQWGDDQWIAWHDANDVDSEEEDEEEEEEPADDDPFAEHNVPPATRPNENRLCELYKLKFGVPPPPKGNSESRLFPGSRFDWMRYKIVNC